MINKFYVTGPNNTINDYSEFALMSMKLIDNDIEFVLADNIDHEFNDGTKEGIEKARSERTKAMLEIRQIILLDNMDQCPVCIVEVQLAKQLGIPIYHHSVVDALIKKSTSKTN